MATLPEAAAADCEWHCALFWC